MKFEIEKLDNGNLKFENDYYRIEVYRFGTVVCATIKPKHVMITLSVVNNVFCAKLRDIGCSIMTAEGLEKLIPSLIIAKDACKELNRLLADGLLDKYDVNTITMKER